MSIVETSPTSAQPAIRGTNTDHGDGIWGQCDAGRGVVGVSSGGTGVWGHTVNGRGLVGVNNNEGTGVWGETDKGRGVVGVSHQDVVVYGKGARAAGFFEGRVEITESVIVQHQYLLDEIKKLQKRVTDLEASVVTVPGGPTPVPIKRPPTDVTR